MWWKIGLAVLGLLVLAEYCCCVLAGRADEEKERLLRHVNKKHKWGREV